MDMNMGSTSSSGGSDMSGMSDGSMMMMMQMYFYASANSTILFKPWVTTNWGEMLGSCIGVAVFAMLYEGLKSFRVWLVVYSGTVAGSTAVGHSDSSHDEEDDLRITTTPPRSCCNFSPKTMTMLFHLLQSFLHIIQVGVAYLLMLIAMTYNAYLFISIIIGAGLGYFVFNFKRPIVINNSEHCH